MGKELFKKIICMLASAIMLASIIGFAAAEVFIVDQEACNEVYGFIIENYDSGENRLDFTQEDFDLLQMRTTIIPEDLKNYIIHFQDLCDEELPFINYNNELPDDKEEIESDRQSMKEGFKKFGDVLKEDSKGLLIGLGIVILLILGINKYG